MVGAGRAGLEGAGIVTREPPDKCASSGETMGSPAQASSCDSEGE